MLGSRQYGSARRQIRIAGDIGTDKLFRQNMTSANDIQRASAAHSSQ
jgi:hypothetical protein